MQKSLRLLIAAALIGLGTWGWLVVFPSPEKIIRSLLDKLATTASFEPKDSRIARVLKAQKITGFFTPDVVISLDIHGFEGGMVTVTGRDELQQAALGWTRIGGLKIEFLDVSVIFGPDKQTAIVNLTGKATLEGQRDFFVQESNFMLKRVKGKWLIYRIETVKTLSQVPVSVNLRQYAARTGSLRCRESTIRDTAGWQSALLHRGSRPQCALKSPASALHGL
jgi:hypothetical protein